MKKVGIEKWGELIRTLTIAKGEVDKDECGVLAYRYHLNLDGAVHIPYKDGKFFTDVLNTHVGTDNALTVLVSTPDDTAMVFVSIDELPYKVVKEILNQITTGDKL